MGIAYQALLNWSLYGRTTFDLGAGRNISYSYQDTEPYYLLTNVQAARHPAAPGMVRALRRRSTGSTWPTGGVAAPMPRRASRTASTRLTAANGGVGIRLGRGFHVKSRRRKDTAAIDRRSAAEFQPHEDLEHRDDGFVRNTNDGTFTVDSDRPRRRMHAGVRAGDSRRPSARACCQDACCRLRRSADTDYVVGPQDVLQRQDLRRREAVGQNPDRQRRLVSVRVPRPGQGRGDDDRANRGVPHQGARRWLSPQPAGVGRGGRVSQPERVRDRRSAIAEQVLPAGELDADGRADAGRIGHAERRQLGADYARAPRARKCSGRRHRPSTTCA